MSPVHGIVVLVALAVATSCADSAPPAATAPGTTLPGFSVTSDDGMVTVEVPPGALTEAREITIRRIDASELPPGLPAEVVESVAVFGLEPYRLAFAEPVTVTARLAVAGFDDPPAGVVPVVTLITMTEDGDGWELLDAQRVLRDGDLLIVSALTNHASAVVVLFEEVHLDVGAVDAGIIAEIELGATARLAPRFFGADGERLDPPRTTPAPVLGPGATAVPSGAALHLTCVDAGDVAATISWNVVFAAFGDRPPSEASLRTSPLLVEVEELRMRLGVVGVVRCVASSPG